MSYKLYNNSGEFKIQHNGFEFTVPAGWFDIQSEKLKNFILNKATGRWGMNISETEPVVESESVKEEVVVEEVKEAVVEEVKPVEVKKEVKKNKTSKKIEDLEKSL
jgi:hypothetical protein